MLELIYRRVQATVSSISDPLARHDAGEVEAALEGLVSAARPTYPSHTVDVNTASLTVSDRSQLPPQAFENAGLPSENVLPGDVPGVPMIFGQSGLGTLGFLNDLSTTNLQTADWFAFFDS